jgi:hypothetical protein
MDTLCHGAASATRTNRQTDNFRRPVPCDTANSSTAIAAVALSIRAQMLAAFSQIAAKVPPAQLIYDSH